MSAVAKSCDSGTAWRDKIATLVDGLGQLPQVECPTKHYFLPGVYVREIFMPAGTAVIGKIHKTEHFNIVQCGVVHVMSEGGVRHIIRAPFTFASKAGVQKVLYIEEDTVWSTVHLTSETDLDKLEALLIEPDQSYPELDRTAERAAVAQAAQRLIE